MFSLICTWINCWISNRKAGDLRRHRVHYDVIVMSYSFSWWPRSLFLWYLGTEIPFKLESPDNPQQHRLFHTAGWLAYMLSVVVSHNGDIHLSKSSIQITYWYKYNWHSPWVYLHNMIVFILEKISSLTILWLWQTCDSISLLKRHPNFDNIWIYTCIYIHMWSLNHSEFNKYA